MNFGQLVTLCRDTHEAIRARAVRAVDVSLVIRDWLFGRYIVEFEQDGADRAEYGAGYLQSLASRLKPLRIKGTGPTNLKLFRLCYLTYPDWSDTVGRIRSVSHYQDRVRPCGWHHPDREGSMTSGLKSALRW